MAGLSDGYETCGRTVSAGAATLTDTSAGAASLTGTFDTIDDDRWATLYCPH